MLSIFLNSVLAEFSEVREGLWDEQEGERSVSIRGDFRKCFFSVRIYRTSRAPLCGSATLERDWVSTSESNATCSIIHSVAESLLGELQTESYDFSSSSTLTCISTTVTSRVQLTYLSDSVITAPSARHTDNIGRNKLPAKSPNRQRVSHYQIYNKDKVLGIFHNDPARKWLPPLLTSNNFIS